MLKPSFLTGLVLAVALAIPCLAFSQTIRGGGGGAAAALTVDFAGTLTGFGGFDTGLSGTVTVSSLTGGSCVNSKDFIPDGNGMIVPNNAAHTYGGAGGNTWPDNTNYGTISASYAYTNACTMVVTNGTTTKTYSVTFTPNAHHVRSMNATTYNADAATYLGWQLGKLMNLPTSDGARNVHLGDTVYVRDGSSNSAALGQFAMYPPAGLYTGAGRITIRSDTASSTTDGTGNFIPGGLANLGSMYISGNFSGDNPIPIDFKYINFYRNSASAPSEVLIQFASNANGVGFYNDYIGNGPLTPASVASDYGLMIFAYNGSNAAAAMDVENNYFANGRVVQLSGAGATCPQITFKNNIMTGMLEKGLYLSAPGGDVVTDNFMFANYSTGSSHGDYIIFGSGDTCAAGPGPTVLRNILLHGDSTQTAINTTTFVSATGTTAANGTYVQLPVTGGHGRYGYIDVTVSGGVYTAVYAAPSGSFTGGATQGGGRGYQVGDQIVATVSTATVTFSVASVQGSPDNLGIFFWPGSRPVTSTTVQNNIVDTVFSDEIWLVGASSPVVNNNDALIDFQSLPGSGFSGVVSASGGADGNFNWNISNTFSITGQTGSPTCLPGAATACTASTMNTQTLAAYQAFWPTYNQLTAYATGYTRANAIRAHTPSAVGSCVLGGGNAGKVTCALNPADNAGVVSWAVPGAVFDPAATHTPAS